MRDTCLDPCPCQGDNINWCHPVLWSRTRYKSDPAGSIFKPHDDNVCLVLPPVFESQGDSNNWSDPQVASLLNSGSQILNGIQVPWENAAWQPSDKKQNEGLGVSMAAYNFVFPNPSPQKNRQQLPSHGTSDENKTRKEPRNSILNLGRKVEKEWTSRGEKKRGRHGVGMIGG